MLSTAQTHTHHQKAHKNDAAAEELLINRLMLLFVAAVCLVVALLLIKKSSFYSESIFVMRVLPFVKIITGVGFGAALAFYIVKRTRKETRSDKLLSPAILLGTAAFLLFLSMTYIPFNRHATGLSLSVISVLVVTALCFIYAFYPRDFFLFSVYTALGCTFLYGSSTAPALLALFFRVLAFALPVAVLAFLLLTRSGKKPKLALLGKKPHLYPFVIGAGMLIAAELVTLLFYSFFLYAILAFLAAFLVIAVVYSVRMI